MPNLFSHVHEPDYVAVQKSSVFDDSVVLGVPPNQAFDGFTDGIHLWWPVDGQSVFGEDSHVAVLREHLVEEADDGEEIVWADVVEWETGEFIRLHWTLGQEQFGSADVDIHFMAEEESQTRVRVVTEQAVKSPGDDDDLFTCDWALILSRYARFMGGALKLD